MDRVKVERLGPSVSLKAVKLFPLKCVSFYAISSGSCVSSSRFQTSTLRLLKMPGLR